MDIRCSFSEHYDESSLKLPTDLKGTIKIENVEISLSKKRYLMNFLLSMLLFLSGNCWISFSAMSYELSIFFDKSLSDINWFSNVFMICPGVMSLISIVFPHILGLRKCLIIGAILNSIGSTVRVIPFYFIDIPKDIQYIICMIGTITLSISQGNLVIKIGIVLNLPSFLSSKWFGAKEREMSTALMCLSELIGTMTGYINAFSIMKLYSDSDTFQMGFFIILISEWTVAMVFIFK